MKIGILGTRGIPNRYGGFEQFAEIVSQYWVGMGHEVWVYCGHKHEYKELTYKGVNRISIFDPEFILGTAGQFFYDLGCIMDARNRNFDVLLQLGYTSSSVWHNLLPKKPLIITNMDGLEWRRTKFSKKVQTFLKRAESWAVRSSDLLVADSVGIQHYLKETYAVDSTFIAYGADIPELVDAELVLATYKVASFEYNLLIARMEPENNIEMILDGIIEANHGRPTLVVGNVGTPFGKYLSEKFKNPSIRFIGGLYDKNHLDVLRKYCFLYYHGHSVGGTNPSLLEAMASESLICAHKNIFNESVLGSNGLYFSTVDEVKQSQLNPIGEDRFERTQRLKKRIETDYSWKKIATDYLTCFQYARKAK